MKNTLPRIVIINEDKEELENVRTIFSNCGYQIFSFQHLEPFLEMREVFKPHLIILDLDNSSSGSINTFRTIRENRDLESVPIVIRTSFENEKKLRELVLLDICDVIPRPTDPFHFRFRIRRNLQDSFNRQEAREFSKKLQSKVADNESLIRILCHDLVNPLTVLKYVSEKSENKMAIMSVNQTFEIIEHIRDMIAIESGKKELKLKPVSLSEVIDESINIMSIRYKEKRILFSKEFPVENFNVQVISERTSLLNQVLNNLLSNAIKFSLENSTIDLSISIDGDHVILKIRDYGVGIPQEIQQNVFSPYIKTSSRGTLNEKGTGFGLPLVKTYMEHYDGDIRFESKSKEDGFAENSGTTFILTFNIAKRTDLEQYTIS